MRWPVEHPACTDDALAPHRGGAEELCAGARVLDVLRHLPGRRVASLVALGDGRLGVLKVFASPRARGNDRRLRALAAGGAGALVPRPLGCDRSGHVSLVEHVPGTVFAALDDGAFVAHAHAIGVALRELHGAPVVLDRRWGLDDELALLVSRATEDTRPSVARRVARPEVDLDAPLVPAHRDCHPQQVVVDEDGHVCWIDLDDAAMAPAGLDLGNMVAHLRRDAALGLRARDASTDAVDALLAGYGDTPADVESWAELSWLRLAALATSRHGRPDWTAVLLGAGAR